MADLMVSVASGKSNTCYKMVRYDFDNLISFHFIDTGCNCSEYFI